MSRFLDKAIAAGLLIAIVFSALAQGIVEPWSMLVFKLWIGSLTALWAIKACVDRKLRLAVPPIVLPLAALIGLGLLQSAAWTDEAGYRQSLSLDVEATRRTTAFLGCLLACCLLAANFLTGAARLKIFSVILSVYGVSMALIAVVLHFVSVKYSYWPWPIPAEQTFGPFINRDHFASYMELLVGWPAALIFTGAVRGEKTLFYGAAAIVMGVAAIFTLSRGGMIGLFAQMLFLAVVGGWSMNRKNRRNGDPVKLNLGGFAVSRRVVGVASVFAIFTAILMGVGMIGAKPVINRVLTGDPDADQSRAQSFHESRGAIWLDTLRIIREKPLIGAGLGAFETAYHRYGWDRGNEGIVAQAHNDYLQALADGGLVGGLLAGWFLISFMIAIARALKSPSGLTASVALGAGAGVFGLLIHSLFDFSLQLPSHAILFLTFSTLVSQIGATVRKPVAETVGSTTIVPGLREAHL